MLTGALPRVERIGETFIPRATLDAKGIEFVDGALTHAPRVYAGMQSGATIPERVARAVNELERVGGFDKARIVVASPTGSGWVNPIALGSAELIDPDVAFVAVQYSTGTSMSSLLTGPTASASVEQLLRGIARRARGHPGTLGSELSTATDVATAAASPYGRATGVFLNPG